MASNVYYSVCKYGTGDIKTGSPTLTISSGVATLSVAQTGNIGQGCRITYDTSSIAYISAVNSSTSFDVVTATGGTPSDEGSSVTVNSIKHEWSDLVYAEAGMIDSNHVNSSDLVTTDVLINIVCYYDHDDNTPDSFSVTFDSITDSDSTRYINIYCPMGGTESINAQFPSDGIFDSNKFYSTGVWTFKDDYTKLTNLQIESSANGSAFMFNECSGGVGKNLISVRTGSNNSLHCFQFYGSASVANKFINCIADYSAATGSTLYGMSARFGSGSYLNCTVYGNNSGDDGFFEQSATSAIAKNCVAANAADSLAGSWDTIDYCASDDGDGTNSQSLDSTSTYANEFTDAGAGDFSLVSGGVCEENGTDLSGSGVADDIIGTSRPQSTNYDIGAFEREAAAGGLEIEIAMHHYTKNIGSR